MIQYVKRLILVKKRAIVVKNWKYVNLFSLSFRGILATKTFK